MSDPFLIFKRMYRRDNIGGTQKKRRGKVLQKLFSLVVLQTAGETDRIKYFIHSSETLGSCTKSTLYRVFILYKVHCLYNHSK